MVHYATVTRLYPGILYSQNIVRCALQVNPIYDDRHGVAFTRPIFTKHRHRHAHEHFVWISQAEFQPNNSAIKSDPIADLDRP